MKKYLIIYLRYNFIIVFTILIFHYANAKLEHNMSLNISNLSNKEYISTLLNYDLQLDIDGLLINKNKWFDAINSGDLFTIKILMMQGFPINETNENGENAILLATSAQNIDLVKILLNSQKVNVNSQTKLEGLTPLIISAHNGNIDILNLLIDANALIDKTDFKSQTPLIYAVKKINFEITKKLIQSGADIKHQDIFKKNSFDWASTSGLTNVAALLNQEQYFLSHPDEYLYKVDLVKTVDTLFSESKKGNVRNCRYLIAGGININSTDKLEATPLDYANINNQYNTINFLRENGGISNLYAIARIKLGDLWDLDIKKRFDNFTNEIALNHSKNIKLFIQAKIPTTQIALEKLNINTDKFKNPLSTFILDNQTDLVDFILSQNYDLNWNNPFCIALGNDNKEILNIFSKYGIYPQKNLKPYLAKYLISTTDDCTDHVKISTIFAPGIHKRPLDCNKGFEIVSTDSIDNLIREVNNTDFKNVILKSSIKYGSNNAFHSLSDNCSQNESSWCDTSNQIAFNHGGDPKSISLEGHIIFLDDQFKSQFDLIALNTIEKMELKNVYNIRVTRESLFDTPNIIRNNAFTDDYYNYKEGSVGLILINNYWYSINYDLFVFRVENVISGDQISISYKKIAEIKKEHLVNYVCSKRLELSNQFSTGYGSTVVFSREVNGYDSSTFGFDFGVNGIDGNYMNSSSDLDFSHIHNCNDNSKELCARFYAGYVSGYLGSIQDIGSTELQDIDLSKWPQLKNINFNNQIFDLKMNHTYLITVLNDRKYTFGAIKITGIDLNKNLVQFNWKRVGIINPYGFMEFKEEDIEPLQKMVSITLTKNENSINLFNLEHYENSYDPWLTLNYDNINKNYQIYIDNRYFSDISGILNVSNDFKTLEDITKDVVDSYENKFIRNQNLELNSIYLVSQETLYFKVILAFQVIEVKPGEFIKLKVKRIYNGRFFSK